MSLQLQLQLQLCALKQKEDLLVKQSPTLFTSAGNKGERKRISDPSACAEIACERRW